MVCIFFNKGCKSGKPGQKKSLLKCYNVIERNVSLNQAKEKCEENGGSMACFSEIQEGDTINELCDSCWVGYNSTDGM